MMPHQSPDNGQQSPTGWGNANALWWWAVVQGATQARAVRSIMLGHLLAKGASFPHGYRWVWARVRAKARRSGSGGTSWEGHTAMWYLLLSSPPPYWSGVWPKAREAQSARGGVPEEEEGSGAERRNAKTRTHCSAGVINAKPQLALSPIMTSGDPWRHGQIASIGDSGTGEAKRCPATHAAHAANQHPVRLLLLSPLTACGLAHVGAGVGANTVHCTYCVQLYSDRPGPICAAFVSPQTRYRLAADFVALRYFSPSAITQRAIGTIARIRGRRRVSPLFLVASWARYVQARRTTRLPLSACELPGLTLCNLRRGLCTASRSPLSAVRAHRVVAAEVINADHPVCRCSPSPPSKRSTSAPLGSASRRSCGCKDSALCPPVF